MKLVSLSLFLIFTCFQSLAQTISIKDKESGAPLDFVSIHSQSQKLLVNTNASGKADISKMKGQKNIQIRLFGYKSQSFSFEALEALNFEVFLQPTAISLQQAVVSATRWSQSRQEIPSKISSISKEERELLNPQTAADLLGISGEVFVQKSQQGGGSPMIRGFSANRLLYTVDGVRMNTAIFRGGNLQNVISLDAFATESTEVLFGPGSIIYGSDAIGAVMSFQTLTPKFSTSAKPEISGSTTLRTSTANGEQTGHIHVGIGGEKWASITSFTRSNYGDLRMGKHGPDEYLKRTYVDRIDGVDQIITNPDPRIQNPSGFSQSNLMQKIRYQPQQNWDFQYGFHYSETSAYSRYDRHIRLRPDGTPRSGEWDYGPQIWMMNNLQITHQSDNKLFDEASLRLAIQNFEESRIDRNFNDATRRTRIEKVNAYSANIDLMKNLNGSSKLFYGFEWILNDVNSQGINENIIENQIMPGPARYPQASWSSAAVYLSYQNKLGKNLLFQTGVRLNSFAIDADFSNNLDFYPLPFGKAELRNSALTGNIGLVYTPQDSYTIHINASTGFRSPNVDDIGKIFDSEPGTVLIPNPNLDAEYAYNAEVGISKVFGENVLMDFSAYYTLLDNAIVRRDFMLNGQDSIIYDGELSRVLALQNAAQATVMGIQAAIEIKLPYNFSLSSRYNIQRGEEETDDGEVNPSRHAPPAFGVTRLIYKKNKWNAQLYSEYAGQMSFEQLPLEERGKPELYAIDTNGNPFSPRWLTLNIKGMYKISDFFFVNVGVENLADIRYRTYSSGIVAPGRNFVFSITGRF
ncbi:hemoglobin/transferrin/lactoferrin receptor protein [Belliella buryatensis]|uniref:Hemoglobin/transferrin/lactoferrin receptor protein n=1 Tax=Belliella buryatensis TaxID=1500549 RepID=A0A239AUP8_9BACT|nr:TonB-dependent receptor [Belliella buryatensis]SNR98693.1 hemoglobin/transferrin/lactoferrin receptor protein [Belliella buryatensis]